MLFVLVAIHISYTRQRLKFGNLLSGSVHHLGQWIVMHSFQEYFNSRRFFMISPGKKELISSFYCQTGYCHNCSIEVNSRIEVLINYIHLTTILALNILPNHWPDSLEHINLTDSVQCSNCDNSSQTNSSNVI